VFGISEDVATGEVTRQLGSAARYRNTLLDRPSLGIAQIKTAASGKGDERREWSGPLHFSIVNTDHAHSGVCTPVRAEYFGHPSATAIPVHHAQRSGGERDVAVGITWGDLVDRG
jgi:hypothetical protein